MSTERRPPSGGDPLRIVVVLGGATGEREISLDTGHAVAEALRRGGHQVDELDPGDDPWAALGRERLAGADAVFVALHGGCGEDGRVQALLELAGVPYVGSRPGPCAVAMDKPWTKQLAREMGVGTADFEALDAGASDDELRAAANRLGFPLVLKPAAEGSALGVHLCADPPALAAAIAAQGERRGRWMLERFVAGRELTVPILWGEATPAVEIRPREGFYDYANKYTAGRTEYLCPAPLDEDLAAQLEDWALRTYHGLQLRDMARVDFRLGEDGALYLLEANTIPGMTGTSLLPMGAKATGMGFDELCDRLVRGAAHRGKDPI